MGIIRRLPAQEIKKIAAGEVVERPANIVKELVENSLDAGARRIEIHVTDGGRSSIRIVDNGCGMLPEDAHTCFEQHATSKIETVEDLSSIGTFGFRGEALSSISAVSEVTLVTRHADQTEGLRLRLLHGEIQEESSVGAALGTDLTIENIFANVPARKKFLKTRETEWNQIVLLFQAFCLTYPGIHFSLTHDGRQVHNCPPVTELQERVAQLWNSELSRALLDIDAADMSIHATVRGLVSNHQYGRYGRNQIFFFVNNRWVKNASLSRSLIKAYSNVHQPGKFPAAFIFIEIDPQQIDVNIHPRKEEVQFLHSRKVEQIIQKGAKERLEKNISDHISRDRIVPSRTVSFDGVLSNDPLGNSIEGLVGSKPASSSVSLSALGANGVSTSSRNMSEAKNLASNFDEANFDDQSVEKNFSSPTDEKLQQMFGHSTDTSEGSPKVMPFQIIGQLLKTYIVVEKDNALVLFDQHAAHERILYEQFASNFESVATVNLMFPKTIKLSPHDYALLESQFAELNEHGVHIEPFGENQVVIKATPVTIRDIDLDDFIQTIIGWLEESSGDTTSEVFKKSFTQNIHTQMACKAAVKANDVLDEQQMLELVETLEKTENRLTCPHGRPTMTIIDKLAIEKLFKRDYKSNPT